MRRGILSVAALLGLAIALAGCGGGGSASGTTSGVAGAHTTKGTASFHADAQGFRANVQSSVKAFENGNLSSAIASGGSLLANCITTVDHRFAPNAKTSAEKQSVRDLRTSCGYMQKAAKAGENGNMSAARSWAKQALKQANLAVEALG